MSNPQTPEEEAEDLVSDLVDDKRSQIKEKHAETINKTVEKLDNIREMNVVFSEIRRGMEEESNMGGEEE